MNGVVIYTVGIVHCSVCVPAEMTVEEVENAVNIANPTEISSRWKVREEKFVQGDPNPRICNEDPERLHYLLTC